MSILVPLLSAGGVADLAGATLVLLGAFLCCAASVGLVRFPDVLSRMHAATKPQTLGLLLVVTGVAASLRTWAAFGTLVLVAVLQLTTAPVSAHLIARTVYRSNQIRRDLIDCDDLGDDLAAAGFHLVPTPSTSTGTATDAEGADPGDGDDGANDDGASDDGASDDGASDDGASDAGRQADPSARTRSDTAS